MSTIPQTGADFGGFFGNVLSSVQKGIGTIAEEVLPRWTANQLESQKYDQLFQPVFDDRYSDRSIQPTTSTVQRPQKAGLLFDNINISTTGLILGGGILLGLILLIKK